MKFKNIENTDPQTCISGKVNQIHRQTGNIFRKYLSPFNITSSQLSVLFVLSKHEGLNQKEITTILQIEKSSLNRNLKRLFERKYLSKKEFPIIKISYKGKVVLEKLIPEWEKAMQEIKILLGTEGEQALNVVHAKIQK